MANQRWFSDLGIANQAVVGKSHSEMFPQTHELQQALQRCLVDATELTITDQSQQIDGSRHWRQWVLRPWYENSGKIGGVVVAMVTMTPPEPALTLLTPEQTGFGQQAEGKNNQLQDLVRQLLHEIHEREQVEIALREKELQLQQCIEYAPMSIGLFDQEMHYLAASQQWLAEYHLTPDIMGCSHYEVFPDISDEWKQVHQRCLAGAIEQRDEDVYVRGDGSMKWVRWAIHPWHRMDGEIGGIVLFSEDITARKQAETALFQLAAIVESSEDAIISKTLDGEIVSWNTGAERLFGYTATEVIGQPISLLIPSDRIDEESQIIEKLKRGEQVEHFDTLRKCKDDTLVDISLTISPVRDTAGNIIGISKIARDIREQQSVLRELRHKTQALEQALQELQKTQVQLIQSEKMSSLGQLVAGVAHEINNPVNFIYGNLSHADEYIRDLLALLTLYQEHYPYPHTTIQAQAEAIDLEFLVQDLPKLLASMKVGSERIQKIVLALRNFSRMDEAEVKEVNIHDGIDSTLLILQNRLKARADHPGIQIIKEYGNLPLVECHAGQLNQVFMNILSNAIDALEERDHSRSYEEIEQTPSQICITTTMHGIDRVCIQITDNGPGIAQSLQTRLFDPFFTTKPVGQGTGLGMSISYQIVTEKHRGTLQCFSIPGQGAKFTIEIPIQANK
jgi:PAS domain S-box-containing protein